MNIKLLSGKAACILTLLASGVGVERAGATLISDFEAPNYFAGVPIAGQDNWTNVLAPGDAPLVTPADGYYTFALQGSQSAATGGTPGFYWNAGVAKQFNTVAGLTEQELVEISWLMAAPNPASNLAYGGLWVFASSPTAYDAGIYFANNSGSWELRVDGGSQQTGMFVTGGGGGYPTIDVVYQFKMVFDFDANTMSAFYRDVTNGGSYASIGTPVVFNTSAADLLANGGVRIESNVGFAFDEIVAVPEPQPALLLGLGAAAMLFIRRRRSA